ncbi:tyrosine-type recombinase/integrase [Limibacillus sp. MBR-115]|jgi:integrase|uniref:tyrosine-type recombinase/integrase n=1 Tax=Limibacillus sp. MBR-115 TaxID=3156465 RepID=UPI00339854D1
MATRFTRLTRPNIRALEPGERITEQGIIAERLPNGDVRYSINVMVDGQRIHRTVGRESDNVTRTQAEELIAQLRTEAREGRLHLPPGRKRPLTFSELADKYVEDQEATGGKNLERKRQQIADRLKPFFKSQRADSLTDFTVKQFIRQRLDEKASPSSVNRELATLSHMYRTAVRRKLIKEQPFHIEKLQEPQGRIIALSDKESAALLAAAIADSDPDCYIFVLFGLNTAMRHREILRARFDQIDFGRLRLFVPLAKAGAREQPITPQLAAALQRERDMRDEKDRDGFIFATPRPGQNKAGHRHRMDKPFNRAVKDAGLDPEQITPHVMRHTAITNLVRSGAPLPVIQRISGHKTLAMVLRYTHVHGSDIDEAIGAIGIGIQDGKDAVMAAKWHGKTDAG